MQHECYQNLTQIPENVSKGLPGRKPLFLNLLNVKNFSRIKAKNASRSNFPDLVTPPPSPLSPHGPTFIQVVFLHCRPLPRDCAPRLDSRTASIKPRWSQEDSLTGVPFFAAVIIIAEVYLIIFFCCSLLHYEHLLSLFFVYFFPECQRFLSNILCTLMTQ